MELVSRSRNLWTVEFPVKMGPGMRIPGRSLVYRSTGPEAGTDAGDLLIVSPGPFTDETWRSIEVLGRVRAIVAPNLFHHAWVRPALERHPQASFFRPVGLPDKIGLEGGFPCEDFGRLGMAGVENFYLRGIPQVQETVFFFPTERILWLTDLVFNIRHPEGPAVSFMLALFGTRGVLNVSRLIRFLIRRRDLVREDLARILQFDFDQVLMAHGEPLQSDAKERLREVFARV